MLSFWNTRVFSVLVPLLLLGCGGYFFFSLRGFCWRRAGRICKSLLFASRGGKSPLRALTVALAGTLGVGNIVGVATAIRAGGAGAVFWMWISALLAMPIKYGETVLAVRYRQKRGDRFGGGPMYYISQGLHQKRLAVLFCLLCVGASFLIGNIVQANAVAQAMALAFSVPPWAVGILLGVLCAVVIFGGGVRISSLTARLIPILSVGYLTLAMAVLWQNASALPALLSRILEMAFSHRAVLGGIGGYGIKQAVRYGVARGLMSNEAGCGTAPIAHAGADCPTAAQQGFLGIAEVAIDTLLLCSATAFVILLSGAQGDGIVLALCAFGRFFGTAAQKLLALSVFFFALATMVGWSFYATESISFLTKNRTVRQLYLALYAAMTLYAVYASQSTLWDWADFFIYALTVLNTVAVFRLRKEVKAETEAFFFANGKIPKKNSQEKSRGKS